MEWAALPPEINSARMYTGPGAQPLIAAAMSWEGIAAQLGSTAASLGRVVDGLTGVWRGMGAGQMNLTMTAYQSWLLTTAERAYETAARAYAAVAAYESAFAATVPPPEIAANRSLLSVLVATNFLGINTPAIMATETQYLEMWAQDVVAMTEYHLASAEATLLPALMPQSFSDLAAGAQAFTGLGGLAFAPIAGVMDEGLWGSPQQGGSNAPSIPGELPAAGMAGVGSPQEGSPIPVSASVGTAGKVGPLSTPQSWGQAVNKGVTAQEFPRGAPPETGAPPGEGLGGVIPAVAPMGAGGQARMGDRDTFGTGLRRLSAESVIPCHPSAG